MYLREKPETGRLVRLGPRAGDVRCAQAAVTVATKDEKIRI